MYRESFLKNALAELQVEYARESKMFAELGENFQRESGLILKELREIEINKPREDRISPVLNNSTIIPDSPRKP